MSDKSILVERRDGYRVITLNRPDRLNAFNDAMHVELRKAIEEIEANESCRALLITGSGRGFCAGQDLADRLVKPGEKPASSKSLRRHNPLAGASCAPCPSPWWRRSTAPPLAPAAISRSPATS